jgi:hypothetical protein
MGVRQTESLAVPLSILPALRIQGHLEIRQTSSIFFDDMHAELRLQIFAWWLPLCRHALVHPQSDRA